MKTLILEIEPLSPLLTSSGQGGVLVDADAVFHPNGFPYIPARRLKGMLRESLMEVLEIMGMNGDLFQKKVNGLFGSEGDDHNNGKLVIGNAYVSPWKDIVRCMSHEDSPSPEDVRGYLAKEIQQTALEKGTAKKHSLRNYRVVLPRQGLTMVSEVVLMKDLDDSELKWLRHATSNLRYMGSRRNRGFGHVKCSLKGIFDTEKRSAYDASEDSRSEKIAVMTALRVKLHTDTPVIISRQDGDNNTLQSDDVVSGSQLRGALARLYMRNHDLDSDNAHLDEDFHTIFLSGRLSFGHLHHSDARAIPAFLHREKYSEGKEAFSVFHSSDVITKAVGGYGTGIEVGGDGSASVRKVDAPSKTSQFHNSRPDRTAGRNTGGQLFYYESLDEGQTFHGEIAGETETLKLFCRHFKKEESVYLGRSKSAQYGKVTVCFEPISERQSNLNATGNSFLLVVETPLVLTNEWGHPALDEHCLSEALAMAFKSANPEIILRGIGKAAGSITHVEHYNGVWHAKNGKFPAYAAGTTFVVEVDGTGLPTRLSLGRFTELGYGAVRILPEIRTVSILDSEKGETGDDGAMPEAPAILSIIRAHRDERVMYQRLEGLAIREAEKTRGLNNHQCGRMERLMDDSKDFQEVSKWLRENSGKPVCDALLKSNVLLNSKKEPVAHIPMKDWESLEWGYIRHYWKAFFSALRKFNKKREDSDKKNVDKSKAYAPR